MIHDIILFDYIFVTLFYRDTSDMSGDGRTIMPFISGDIPLLNRDGVPTLSEGRLSDVGGDPSVFIMVAIGCGADTATALDDGDDDDIGAVI